MTAPPTTRPALPQTIDSEATIVDGAPPLPSEQDPLVGSVVDDRYEVVSLLGEGGMGRLYEVRHVVLKQRAVLKTILPKFARDPRVVARFIREARAASQIGNAHIVDVRDSGKLEDGRAYYVMEHLDGFDVRELLDDVALIDEAQALDIATQVLSALEAADAAGLVHRDLKPENIFLTRDAAGGMHAKVVDFGLVRFTEISGVAALTKAGELVGTPHYMSPEQCRGAAVDIRSDLYSLGLVIYEMVTGEVPYEELEFLQVVLHKTMDEWPPLAPLERLASPELCAVLCRCLIANPDKRFASPREMRENLEAVRSGGALASGVTQLAGTFEALSSPSPSGDVPASPGPLPAGSSISTARPAHGVEGRGSRSAYNPVRGAFASALATFAVGAAVMAALLLVVVAPCMGESDASTAAYEGAEAGVERDDDDVTLAPTRTRAAESPEVHAGLEPPRTESTTAMTAESTTARSTTAASTTTRSTSAVTAAEPTTAEPDVEPSADVTAIRLPERRHAHPAYPAPAAPASALSSPPPSPFLPAPSAATRTAPRSASDRSGVLNPWE